MPDQPTPRAEAEALLAGLEFVSLSFALELLTDAIADTRRVEHEANLLVEIVHDAKAEALVLQEKLTAAEERATRAEEALARLTAPGQSGTH